MTLNFYGKISAINNGEFHVGRVENESGWSGWPQPFRSHFSRAVSSAPFFQKAFLITTSHCHASHKRILSRAQISK